ncbi:MAG: hypothetical protein ACRDIB_14470, partial [Ardenticatenaceae bacterium]
SDERRSELISAVERLANTLPEMKRSAKTLEEVVSFQQSALLRVQRQVDALQHEHQHYAQQRDQELARVDTTFEARQGALRDHLAPAMKEIGADLHFFEKLVDHFNTTLGPFRVNLVMGDEETRPYNQVVRHAYGLLADKQAAVAHWAEQVRALIQGRRAAVQKIVAEIDAATLDNFGIQRTRIVLLPVWLIETRAGKVNFWPWQREQPAERIRLLGPFAESEEGGFPRVRLALPGNKLVTLAPIPAFQQRLDDLLEGERRDPVLEAARLSGRVVPCDGKRLRDIAHACQMPRAMVALLQSLQRAAPRELVGQDDGASPVDATAASDEFVLISADGNEDEWEEAAAPGDGDPDAWEEPDEHAAL